MTDDISPRVAANIRALRERRSQSQAGLAAAVGVSRNAVAKWEAGGTQIGAANLTAVAQALEVSITRLLGFDESTAFRDGYAAGWAACRARMVEATATGVEGGVL